MTGTVQDGPGLVVAGAGGYLPGNGLLPAFGLAYLAAHDVARHAAH
jgi:fumarate reductase flavoprotein subunit